jgi:GTP:adenosylcobinamide-phosphate guanylyltransferase
METGGGYKALLDIHGKPMIQWVLDAIGSSELAENVVVVGLPSTTSLTCRKPLTILPDQNGMLENLKTGIDELLRQDPGTDHILAVSSDIPGITPSMVDWIIRTVSESNHDIYYNVIPRASMERRYPDSRRTYTRLKKMEVCGGDINAVRASLVNPKNPLFSRIIDSRKNPVRQASLIGFDTLFLLLLGQLSLEDAVTKVCKRLGVKGRAIICPYPEVGMDIDKPHQLEILRADLARQTVA